MGTTRLMTLARGETGGAARALHAELVAGQWRTSGAARAAFPAAVVEGERLIVPVGPAHCVEVAFGYEVGIALITFAGRRVDRSGSAPVAGKRR